MTVSLVRAISRYQGLSGDTKPTSGVVLGSMFFETDTANSFTFDGTNWQAGSAAGGYAIVISQDGLTHVRETIVLDGTASKGQAGALPLFTITGRVLLERFTAHITSGVSAGGGTLAFGVTGLTTAIEAASNSVNGATGFLAAGAAASAGKPDMLAGVPLAVSANVIGTVGTADITGGTLVVDTWYRAITSDGVLVAA